MSAKTLLCRCEDVTLDEVQHCLDEGLRELEEIKRYTGFGTGWCQGRQCLVPCARFIAAHTGQFPSTPFTARPPVHPVTLGGLAALCKDEEKP